MQSGPFLSLSALLYSAAARECVCHRQPLIKRDPKQLEALEKWSRWGQTCMQSAEAQSAEKGTHGGRGSFNLSATLRLLW